MSDAIGGKIVPATGNWQNDYDYNFLGHWDVPDGGFLTLTIERIEKRIGAKIAGKTQNAVLMFFKEKNLTAGGKPMIINKDNNKILSTIFRTGKRENWIGKRVILYSKFIKTGIYVGDALRFKDELPDQEIRKQVLDVSSANFEQIKTWLSDDKNKLTGVTNKYDVTPEALEVLKQIKSE